MSNTPRRKTSLLDWTKLSSSGFASFAASLSGTNNSDNLSSSNPQLNNLGKENVNKLSPQTSLISSGSLSSSNSDANSGRNTSTSSCGPPKSKTRKMNEDREVMFEGYLLKRGEHFKSWRTRYFVLYDDGSLLGWKKKEDQGSDPLNVFTVKDVQLMKVEKPRPNTFLMRGLQWTTVIERTFAADNAAVRDQWMNAIHRVAETLTPIVSAVEVTRPVPRKDPIPELPLDFSQTKESTESKKQKPTADEKEVTIDSFEFLKVLGKGTFGKVILVKEKRTANLYAIKLLKKEVIVAKDEVTHTYTENRVLQRCKHPFLTQMIYTFQSRDRLCFVMEFASGGDLYTLLNSESRSRFYGSEIVLALGYLHENAIIYRDLKLENILLDREGHIKIADFGLCKEDVSFTDRTRTFCGTPEYLAPEILEDNDYGLSCDWWGLGVVLFELMCGRLPFYSREHDKLFEMILRSNLRFPSALSSEARSLLSGLLIKDPNARLGGGIDDYKEIQIQSFFASVDWDKLYRKQIPPPFIPRLNGEMDTSYFDAEFTGEAVQVCILVVF
ncbi:Non-specific serine/threonine protein kinase [Aphelenchoides besseyi]|nr:Non-specific serine/threonine protein kinase [Aphelenchoides besseyi]